MGITSKSNFENASAIYRTLFDEVFLGEMDPSQDNWQLYSRSEGMTGTAFEYRFLNDLPEARKWIGKKEFKASRANKHRISVEDYEQSTSVSKVDYLQDPEGVGSVLRRWLSGARGHINQLVVEKFLLGDTDVCFDGLSLFNTAHPNGPGGTTQSNRVTTTLSQAAYRTAKSAMRTYKGPSGRPLGIRPDLLMVGPTKEDQARDIIEARDRVVAVDNAGLESGTRVAAAAIENVISGDGVRLLVEPRIGGGVNGAGADTSNMWFLMDSRLPAMVVGIAQAPYPQDDTDEFLAGAAEYHFSIESQLAIGYGLWYGVYAGLATS